MDTAARIRRFVPVQRLSAALQDKAIALADIEVFKARRTIYGHGDSGDTVHFLIAGSVEFIWDNKVTRSLSASNKAALRALDPPGRKRYTVRASTAATIARFKRAALDRLVEQFETSTENEEVEVSEIAAERSSDWMIRMLQSELFTVLPATNIQKVFARMELIEYKAEEVVVRQGSPGEYYYVIESGYCEVARTIASGRGQIHLADLGPGTAFGEEALIADRERNASITMLSDGRLMRLGKQDFIELILNEVLHPVTLEQALADIDNGGVWLDIRYPEDHARVALQDSENIPVNMLRLQSNRLRKDFRYIVCGDDIEQCAIAAYLLSERGFDAGYLTVTVTDVVAGTPALAQTAENAESAAADLPATIVYLPGSNEPDNNQTEDTVVETTDTPDTPDEVPLENTITRIAGLYTHAEAQREMNNKVPVDQYAETATGRALADIIDELAEQHDDLGGADRLSAALAAEAALPAPDPAAQEAFNDGLSALMQEMEGRLRAQVDEAVRQRSEQLESEYREKLTRMRDLTNQEIEQREAALRRRLAEEYNDKEQLLRSYYKKLIALANSISRQKAQLQEAKKQFERKLSSANQLYREIEEMRELLSDQIGYLDAQQLDEIPRLSLSL